MNVKFKKTVAADYLNRWGEMETQTFNRGSRSDSVNVLDNGNWVDIEFDNGAVAYNIPKDSIEIC